VDVAVVVTRSRCWTRVGECCGRDDPVKHIGGPFGDEPVAHLRTVLASTWKRSPAALIDRPPSSTQATIRRRPAGVNGAFGCRVLA